ncbi:sirohydrochlorin cobaltochelatase [Helicovermis profundi]|uniref:Sirohydrochlorin cobaltochelatase n=1 Tax=Helicovermis profundi TaxID=3065157 RepID=A0AAU9EDU2_9FIRM|nr:hypothetical protein HLPR_11630 [Clostridia bacterium S502]
MRKGILIVSYGTTNKVAREKSINLIENKIEKLYPNYTLRSAFTSEYIIKKIKKNENIKIDTVISALKKMIEYDCKEIFVLPLFITPGNEYEKIEKATTLIKNKFKVKIILGLPLLHEKCDYKKLISAALNKIPIRKKNQSILFMGHGTSHNSNKYYSVLQENMSSVRKNVFIANIDGEPYLEDILKKIVTEYKSIIIVPFLLVAGNHVLKDMIGKENSFKSILEKNGLEVEVLLEGLGENNLVQDIFIELLEKMLNTEHYI